MHVRNGRTWLLRTVITAVVGSTVVLGQGAQTPRQGTVFRATANFVRTDVVVRDEAGRFVPDLGVTDFKVYEDGVLQNITLFSPWIGGRSLGNLTVSGGSLPGMGSAAPEGLILPTARPKTDSSGRLFIVFIDDLHVTVSDTPLLKSLLGKVRDLLVHDNDLVGFVSTGTSSIAIDPSYDFGHRRFNEAINKVMGSAPSPDEYIESAAQETQDGPLNVRFNAHTTFKTAYELLDQLAEVTDRRKAFVWVSSGYTFNPFKEGRLKSIQDHYASLEGTPEEEDTNGDGTIDSSDEQENEMETLREQDYNKRTSFSEADLVGEIAQLTRAAQRSNVSFYTLDPRGLMTTGADAATRTQISYADFRDFHQTTISSLRVLAEQTGGLAGVESNDFERMIRRIDSDTSDFYQLGYNSTNPDPTRVRRYIKIESTRPEVKELLYRNEYTIPRTNRR